MAHDADEETRGRARRFRFVVEAEDAALRLDQVLARRVPDLSRRKARLAIELGAVFVDRARVKVLGRRVAPGQRIELHRGGALERASPELGAAARSRDAARLPSFAIVHEDAELVVVDKPSGLLTAPTPESDRNNLADLLARRGGAPQRVWVVHRLDLETSGLVCFAKTERSNRILSERFREHDIERHYLAVAAGRVAPSIDLIDAPVGGRPARSQVSLIRELPGASLLRVVLETGRTHQVRIHLQGIGHPVLGDRRYGGVRAGGPPRLALHATRLGFRHPATEQPLLFDRPWPPDLRGWLDRLDADSR